MAGEREQRLLIDAERGSPGLYLVGRAELGAFEPGAGALPGRTRNALLLFRKHLDGRRLESLERLPGERWLLLRGAGYLLSLRFSAPAPALTLVVAGQPLASLGSGPAAWPPPAPQPEREWDRVTAEQLAFAAQQASQSGRSAAGGLLRACPGLGPILARELARDPGRWPAVRRGLADPAPVLVSAVALGSAHDADLAPPHAPLLRPFPPSPDEPGVAQPQQSWSRAAALWRAALERGRRFERARRAALEVATRERRRLTQLELNLARDRALLPEPVRLRREADALLAAPHPEPDASGRVQVSDPWSESGAALALQLEPGQGARSGAEQRYARARRAERARLQLETRLAETRQRLELATGREQAAQAVRDLAELPAPAPPRQPARAAGAGGGPRHYLTSRGLSLLVGRGARENHQLTFGRARPEDLWFHVRDRPGAHVILRDPEGRAAASDRREAAEVAAHFSEGGAGGWVDVSMARRKHLRPAKGGPGRVSVFHSETLRVEPRDPEGRLRRRP